MDNNNLFDLFASLKSLALRHGFVVRLEFCAGDVAPKDAWRCRVFDGEDLLACYTEPDVEWRQVVLEAWLQQCYVILTHVCAQQARKGENCHE